MIYATKTTINSTLKNLFKIEYPPKGGYSNGLVSTWVINSRHNIKKHFCVKEKFFPLFYAQIFFTCEFSKLHIRMKSIYTFATSKIIPVYNIIF
jgi:hypothetical protein